MATRESTLLAAVVGVTDIDPFVLSLAHGSEAALGRTTMAVAVLIAASSNNLLKAAYAVGFAGWRKGRWPLLGLAVLSLLGLVSAAWLVRGAG